MKLALALCMVAACASPDPRSPAVDAASDATRHDAACAGSDEPCGFVPSRFTSNFGCAAAGAPPDLGFAIALAMLVALAPRGRRRRWRARLVSAVLVWTTGATRAEDLEQVAPTVAPPRRHVAITNDPIGFLLIGRYGGNVELVPGDHHGVIVSPYYTRTTGTERTNFPRFSGWGGEIGYRYYVAPGGPRGLYLNPSLIGGRYRGRPGIGDSVDVTGFGAAFDVGFQAILGDRCVVGIGAGLQATWTDRTLPRQDLPVSIYANAGVRGRFIVALGIAF